MKYAFVLAWQVAFPVSVMCRVLGISTSGFYSWRAQPVSARKTRDAALLDKVGGLFGEFDGTYGSPRIHAELRADGHFVSRSVADQCIPPQGDEVRRSRASADAS